MDTRYQQLAQLLVGYSTKVGRGDLVLLQTDITTPHAMNVALCDAVREKGGVLLDPIITDPRLTAVTRKGCTERSLRVDAASMLMRYLAADVNLVIGGKGNPFEPSALPAADATLVNSIYTRFTLGERVDSSRWVLTRWPTPGFAQLAGLSTDAAEEMFFAACLADYEKMARHVSPLHSLMLHTDKVEIIGPGTNLAFSIKGIDVVPCTGGCNVPDGECFTAPVRDSVNGTIQYNTLTITKSGDRFEGVGFEVHDGKIVRSWCKNGDPSRIERMLDTDEGARYFGEFSLGLNWGITRIIGDTLFDEKVGGTFHLTPGKSYDDAPNGNTSGIHWDIVCDQREAAGGGEIWFDGTLIRRDGLFVIGELEALNPAHSND